MASDRESTRPGSSGTATANSSVLEPRAQKAEQDDQQPQPPTDADGDLAPVTTSHSRVFMGADGKPQFKPSRDFYLAFLSLATIVLAVAFDATSLSVALPDMSFDLGGTALEAFWAGTSFLLASTVFQPTVAGLSNIFGRKYVRL